MNSPPPPPPPPHTHTHTHTPPSLPQYNLIPTHDNWCEGISDGDQVLRMDDSAALNDRKADSGTNASVKMHTDTCTVDIMAVLER